MTGPDAWRAGKGIGWKLSQRISVEPRRYEWDLVFGMQRDLNVSNTGVQPCGP